MPEDRKRHGLVLPLTIARNLTLPTLRSMARFGFVSSRREKAAADASLRTMDIHPRTPRWCPEDSRAATSRRW
ncbi:hypothetical protein [Kineococcus arenarius]|uniref:hypothetical protein n=1 Tax=unclassified Kineococcus TaxID=2621656 RepID=UPI003D7ED545